MAESSTVVVRNIDPPPSRIPMYSLDGKVMNSTWERWFTNMWQRVGSGSGNIIYDANAAAIYAAALAPQISALRSELGQELNQQISFAVSQLQQARDEVQPGIQIVAAPSNEAPPTINIQLPGNNDIPINPFSFMSLAASAQARSIPLDDVLLNGNVSALSMTTGSHTISTLTGPSLSLIDSGATQEWRIRHHVATSSLQIFDATSSNTRIGITDVNGYITLGTGNAYNTDTVQTLGNLSVRNAAVTSIRFSNTTNAQTNRLLYDPSNARLAFRNDTSAAYVLTMHDATDNVTIGTTVDDGVNRLQVSGGVNVTGTTTSGAFSGVGTLLTALNASNLSSGTVAVARGGTGLGTLTANNVILGNGTGTPLFVAPSTSGNVLQSNGTTWISAAPTPAAPNYEEFVATAAQTVFNTTMNTTAKAAGKSYMQVFVNGVFQQEGATKNYTVTGATQITFTYALTLSDDVAMYGFS